MIRWYVWSKHVDEKSELRTPFHQTSIYESKLCVDTTLWRCILYSARWHYLSHLHIGAHTLSHSMVFPLVFLTFWNCWMPLFDPFHLLQFCFGDGYNSISYFWFRSERICLISFSVRVCITLDIINNNNNDGTTLSRFIGARVRAREAREAERSCIIQK